MNVDFAIAESFPGTEHQFMTTLPVLRMRYSVNDCPVSTSRYGAHFPDHGTPALSGAQD